MPNTDFSTIKETFKQCLYKIALQKIKYIPQQPLKTLVDYVSEEYINVYTQEDVLSPDDFKFNNTPLYKKHKSIICATINNNDKSTYITKYFKMFRSCSKINILII